MTTAIILAGGESSRLRPLGDKSLQRFMGRSLLRRHLDILTEAGVTDVVIVTGPHNDAAIHEECAEVAATYVMQPEPQGMGDAVALALEVVRPGEPVYLTQAHDLLAPGFHRALLALARQRPDAVIIAAKRVESYFPGGYLLPAPGAQPAPDAPFDVNGVVEKPGAGNEPSDWVTLVAHLLPHAGDLASALADAVTGSPGDRYERALSALMRRAPALAMPHAGATASLKYPWHMLDIMDLILRSIDAPQIDLTARIAEGAQVRGPVIVAAGTRLFPGAAVIGPAYIGPGTIVGNNALVRESMTGARCIVGYGTEVARSWLGDDVWFHTNYVGDAVIDSNVSFGSGTVTGNLRLDEGIIKVTVKGERVSTWRNKLGQIVGSGTRVGINASLMPGVVIGRNAFVGPGVVLGADVPDGKRVTLRQVLDWADNTVIPRPEDRDAFRGKL